MRFFISFLIGGVVVSLLLVVNAATGVMDAQPPLPVGARADFVLVEKSAHRLTLYSWGEKLRSYSVALGRGGLAPKQRQGDGRTPEGRYRIDARLVRSGFHKALHISYPSPADVRAARQRHVRPGGAIMIHGLRNGFGWIGRWHRLIDWTNGCIAVTDREIDEISRVVPDGTPVEIRH